MLRPVLLAILGATICVAPSVVPAQERQGGVGAVERQEEGGKERAQRVEALLDELQAAGSQAEAKGLERRILAAWNASGSPTIDLLHERATAAIEKKDYPLALEYLDTIVSLAPDFAEGWNKRATVYYLIDNYELSIADIGRALSIQPRHFAALAGLGMIFREINAPDRALAAFRKAQQIHPYLGDIERPMETLELEVEGRGI